jgi:hypothetical protein
MLVLRLERQPGSQADELGIESCSPPYRSMPDRKSAPAVVHFRRLAICADLAHWGRRARHVYVRTVVRRYVDGTLDCVVTNPDHIPDWPQRLTFQLDAVKPDMGSSVVRMQMDSARIYALTG